MKFCSLILWLLVAGAARCDDDEEENLIYELLAFPTYANVVNVTHPTPESTTLTYTSPIGMVAVGVEPEKSAPWIMRAWNHLTDSEIKYDHIKYFFADVFPNRPVVIDFSSSPGFRVVDAQLVNGKLTQFNETHVVGVTGNDGFFEVNATIQGTLDQMVDENNGPLKFGYVASLPRMSISTAGEIYTVASRGLSLVFDMDETLKYFGWSAPRAFKNMFFRNYTMIPGANTTLLAWHQKGMPQPSDNFSQPVFFYESLSPWQLNPSLMTFVRSIGLPMGPFAIHKLPLDNFRPTRAQTRQILDYADVAGKKVESIGLLIEQRQNRSYILCGDTAMHDPEAYGELMQKYPNVYTAAAIRLVNDKAKNTEKRFNDAFNYTKLRQLMRFTEWSQLESMDIRKFILAGQISNVTLNRAKNITQ
jgi:phosphatidate phosphatase APP1